jgi:NADH-quinone oxidoreductase subunit J
VAAASLLLLLPVSSPARAGEAGGGPVVVARTADGAVGASAVDPVPLVERYREGGGGRRQSSTSHAVMFWVGAVLALAGAVVVITARRPMRSALGLLLSLLATAGLYLLLRAHLLAAVQALVYAGAVVVLLVFVITFLDQGSVAVPGGRRLPVRILSVTAVAWVFYLVAPELARVGLGTRLAPAADFGTTESLGRALFTTYLVPFEALSALLLAAIVGAVAVARGDRSGAGGGKGGG